MIKVAAFLNQCLIFFCKVVVMPVVNKNRSLSHELRAGEKLTPEMNAKVTQVS
jgi:hypothetical protein